MPVRNQHLYKAKSAINYGPDHWNPLASTASKYAEAADDVRRYNKELADGTAYFNGRIQTVSNLADSLYELMASEGRDLSSADKDPWPFSIAAREKYYHGLGTAKIACEALKALGPDLDNPIVLQTAQQAYEAALRDVCDPLTSIGRLMVVSNSNRWLSNDVGSMGSKITMGAGSLRFFHDSLAAAANHLTPR